MTSLEEYAKQINQEIKDKKLGYKDPEYYRLKTRVYQQKTSVNCECPECGKLIALRTYKSCHRCKGKREDVVRLPQTDIIKFNTEILDKHLDEKTDKQQLIQTLQGQLDQINALLGIP